MTGEQYLHDIVDEFLGWRQNAERALAQVSHDSFFARLDPESNSIAIIVKHLAGNFRSRWQSILTTDGEKPDRHRDTEFELTPDDTRDALMQRWNEGWELLLHSLRDLTPADLDTTIYIRSQPHPLYAAIHRAVTHVAQHVGQIILLAKHYSGPDWSTLTIAKGESEEFNRTMRKRGK